MQLFLTAKVEKQYGSKKKYTEHILTKLEINQSEIDSHL